VSGTYFIFVKTDYNNTITESDEDNNLAGPVAVTVQNGPMDLVMNSMTGYNESPVDIGGSLSFSGEIELQSDFNILDSVPVAFYLSKDTLKDAGDHLVGIQKVGSWGGFFSPGTPYSFGTPYYPVPAGIEEGSYYVLAAVDDSNKYEELNEANNVVVSDNTLEIRKLYADLIVSMINLNTPGVTIYAGSNVEFYCEIQNSGELRVDTVNVGLFLSRDKLFDGDDTLVLTKKRVGISNDIGEVSGEIVIPGGAQGQYFVIAVVDYDSLYDETVESNNTMVSSAFTVSSAPSGVIEVSTGFSVYPNPASDRITVSWDSGVPNNAVELEMIDLTGKIVKRFAPVINQQTIELENLPAGYYFIRSNTYQNLPNIRLLVVPDGAIR
jgi:hypothetical protein